MQGKIFGLLAETHVHPGAGQSEGAIDLPVARERTTDYPFVPGSGVKGALRDLALLTATSKIAANDGAPGLLLEEALASLGLGEHVAEEFSGVRALRGWALRQLDERLEARAAEQDDDEQHRREQRLAAEIACESCYGRSDNAGELLVSDAKLLLLPVRSLTGAYKWLTCPYLIERFQRDRQRVDRTYQHQQLDFSKLANAGDVPPVLVDESTERLFLEERVFQETADKPTLMQVRTLIQDLIDHDEARGRLARQLAIVSDDHFAWFARYGLPVQAHNKLSEAKTSEALWYEETIAPDTLFYTLAFERKAGVLGHLTALFQGRPYLQLGGNETIGQGWFRVAEVSGATP